MSDDELLQRLADVLKQSRRVESVLVAHIAEVDARNLYAREGCPSMYQYCRDALHLSESEAYRRIAAARVSRKYPVILEMLEDGRIHLAAISELKAHLTADNYKDVLARATHKSKEEVKQLVAALNPKPDVAPSIRKRPERKAKPTTAKELCLDTVEPTPPAIRPAPRPVVEPLAPARYKVEFTASQELRDKLKRLEALMPGSDLGAVIDAAVSEKLERLEARRFGKTKRPSKLLEDADTSPGMRGISAAVRRFVCERDENQCVFVSTDGTRCPETERLEFHHRDPYGKGGSRGADNICLMCRTHNAYMAELDYGKEKMDRFRRPADRVGEPRPLYGRQPDKPRAHIRTHFAASRSESRNPGAIFFVDAVSTMSPQLERIPENSGGHSCYRFFPHLFQAASTLQPARL